MSNMACPDQQKLAAYALGKLPRPEFELVARHVAACPSCEDTVAGLDAAGDTLVAGLRQKQPEAEPFAAEPELQEAADAARQIGAPLPQVSTTAEQPAEKRARPVLGQYRLLSRLGQGGMGTVYKALHVELQKLVALKVLSPHLVGDRQAVARFRREMKAVGRLEHPNLVRAMDAGQAEGRHFLVMEYVEGPSLAQLVKRLGRLPVADACDVVRQAALGLQYAHEQGMVHRDVKPSNLVLTREGKVKVLDLGLALLAADDTSRGKATDTNMAVGTADYIAPEQVSDSHHVDIRADVYSLGCTFYELLTGRAPFSGPEYGSRLQRLMAHVQQPVPPPRQFRPDLPEDLVAVLECMLAKAPEDRYSQPREVVEALRPFCAGARPARLLDAKAEGRGDSGPATPPPLTTKGTKMSPPNTGWYLAGPGNQRQGPFSTEQIIQAWQEGRVPEETPCTRPGMSGWMPLYQVEPFATVIRGSSIQAKRRGGLGRMLVVILCAGCLGAVGFFGWKEYERRFGPAAANGPLAGLAAEATLAQLLDKVQEVQGPERVTNITIVIQKAVTVYSNEAPADAEEVKRLIALAEELVNKPAVPPEAAKAAAEFVFALDKHGYGAQALQVSEPLERECRREADRIDAAMLVKLEEFNEKSADERVKELVIADMDNAAFVKGLALKPDRCHVVRVNPKCTLDTFTTQQQAMFKTWVKNGGIVWATNDVLGLFDIEAGDRGWTSGTVCKAATTGDVCPILDGCTRVGVVPAYPNAARSLKSTSDAKVVDLLVDPETGRVYWSVVQYGKGYVSDVKEVDTSTHDGARFWRNFRRFCLGDIPIDVTVPAARSTPVPKSKSPASAKEEGPAEPTAGATTEEAPPAQEEPPQEPERRRAAAVGRIGRSPVARHGPGRGVRLSACLRAGQRQRGQGLGPALRPSGGQGLSQRPPRSLHACGRPAARHGQDGGVGPRDDAAVGLGRLAHPRVGRLRRAQAGQRPRRLPPPRVQRAGRDQPAVRGAIARVESPGRQPGQRAVTASSGESDAVPAGSCPVKSDVPALQ